MITPELANNQRHRRAEERLLGGHSGLDTGPPPESHLIRYGFLESWYDLERWLFQDVYNAENGAIYPVWRAGIDTGGGEGEEGEASMTEQTYHWLRTKSRGRVFGIKGSSRSLAGVRKW